MTPSAGAAPPPSPPARPAAWLLAWLGAALFAAALAYFGFSYFVTFATVEAGSPTARSVAWNVALFSAFALHHSVFARERVRAWVARRVPPMLERSLYVWVSSLSLIVVCAGWQPVGGLAWDVRGAGVWLLWTAQGVGIWLTVRSAIAIDVRALAGIRQLRTPDPGPGGTATTEFELAGPYGLVRHPIYLGWFLIVFAVTPMTMTRLVFAVTSAGYVLAAIPLEERSLLRSAGDPYRRYMQRVKWKLLPGLYGWLMVAGG